MATPGPNVQLLARFLVLATCLIFPVAGQGLLQDDSRLGALERTAEMQDAYAAALARGHKLIAAYADSVSARMCSRQAGTLCGADVDSTADRAALLLATSPMAYDNRNASQTGGFSPISPPLDQGDCTACVAFALAAAAEAAIATRLRRSALGPSTPALSPADLFFCDAAGLVRSTAPDCATGWTLTAALPELTARRWLRAEACLPFKEVTSEFENTCAPLCRNTSVAGEFRYTQKQPLKSIADVQRHIRTWGGVVTGMSLPADFRSWMVANPRAVYDRPDPPSLAGLQGHAVLVTGYDNTPGREHWVVKNSYGPGWGDGGFFKIRYGRLGMMDPQQTLGVMFAPASSALQEPPAVRAPPSQGPDCWWYTSVAGDYLSKVAGLFGVGVQDLLSSNAGALPPDLSAFLPPGRRLLVCGPGVAMSVSTVDVLLEVKRAIDGNGVLPWSAAERDVCKWLAITCDASGNVTSLRLKEMGLVGMLPDASLLQRLPRLSLLGLGNNSLSGPLQPGYASLSSIEELDLWGNKLTGTLPDQWSALQRLRQLDLSSNVLSGSLPASWHSLKSLELLYLFSNRLSGPLPPSWSSMERMENLLLGAWMASNGVCDGNSLSGTLPASWSALRHLKVLGLGCNSLQGPAPPQWGALSKLTQLMLYNNKLTLSLPAHWGNLAALEILDLSDNTFTGTIPAEWGSGMQRLKECEVYGNPGLHGCFPRAWNGRLHSSSGNVSLMWSGTAITRFC